jgi:hypothetical protein
MEALLAKLRSWAISKIGEEFEEIIDQVISSLKESLN